MFTRKKRDDINCVCCKNVEFSREIMLIFDKKCYIIMMNE